MVGERERAPSVEADHLEDAVAAIEAVIRQGENRFPGGRHLAIDACEFSCSHGATLVHVSVRAPANRRLRRAVAWTGEPARTSLEPGMFARITTGRNPRFQV
jgi:hypothetical protein